MSAPNNGRGVLVGLLLAVAVIATGLATWQVLEGNRRPAGWAALAAAAALVISSMAVRGPVLTFLDAIAYRAFDAAILGSIAWELRAAAPGAATAALSALAFGFLASYAVARGRALGYAIWGSTANRAIRSALVVIALLAGSPFWLWALAVFSALTALVRASQAFKEARQ